MLISHFSTVEKLKSNLASFWNFPLCFRMGKLVVAIKRSSTHLS